MEIVFHFYFPRKKYGGVLCGSFSPAPSDGGHPPAVQSFWCVRAGVMECWCLCGRHPFVKLDRMSASPRSTRHPELVSGSVGGGESKEKDSEINSEWRGLRRSQKIMWSQQQKTYCCLPQKRSHHPSSWTCFRICWKDASKGKRFRNKFGMTRTEEVGMDRL